VKNEIDNAFCYMKPCFKL